MEMRWISTKQRLPYAEYGESNTVLCYTDLGLVKLLYFDGGNWCHPTGEVYILSRVTHWMPLPEPPEDRRCPTYRCSPASAGSILPPNGPQFYPIFKAIADTGREQSDAC